MLLAFEFIFVPNAWSPESAEFTAGIIAITINEDKACIVV
jgi:hypothetical protein